MAKGQQQGGALTVWMIVFVALWLTSTVVLVILYTGQSELKDKADRLTEANETLISASERGAVTLVQQARRGGPTVVGLLEGARAATAALASGDEKDDQAAIAVKHSELFGTIRSDGIVPNPRQFSDDVSYHEGMTKLYETYGAEFNRRKEAETRLTQLVAEFNSLAESTQQQKADLDKRASELGEQLAAIEAERDKYRTDRDAQLADLQKEFEARDELNTGDLTRARQRNTELEEQVRQLEARVTAFQEKCGELLIGPKELATAREPDGRIVTYIPGDDVVYINLGRKDKLVLGLRFAVYGAATGVPVDGRAKAQIEVVSINPGSAECRIVGISPGQVIMQGDLIANPIYDPRRQVTFLVLGGFDLDHDGAIDPDGGAQVEAMIDDWGGVVSSELTAVTDFVVLGGPPRRPIQPRDQSAENVARFNAMQQVYDAYVSTVNEAKALSVPILRQQVFLNFLGYGDRRASR